MSDSPGDSGSSASSSSSDSSYKTRNAREKKKQRQKSSSDSSRSGNSHHSMGKLSPSGLCFPRRNRTRRTVRHIDTMIHRKPKDKYEAIVDRLGAMADSADRKVGSPSKIELFTVSALRGSGLRKVTLGAGTYGVEITNCLRREGYRRAIDCGKEIEDTDLQSHC